MDIHCEATKEWIDAQCSIDPVRDTNPVGTMHQVTVTVTENGGVPAPVVAVNFEIVSGPNAGFTDADITNLINGTVTFSPTRKPRWEQRDDSWGMQHDCTMLANGHITLFANGQNTGQNPFSRVIEFDPATRQTVWAYQGNPPWTFFSPHTSGEPMAQ